MGADRRQGHPRVGGTRKAVESGHGEVMVGPEKSREALLLGQHSHGQLLVEGGTQLGFNKDAQLHAATLPARQVLRE